MRLTSELKETIPYVRRFSAMLVGRSSAFDGYLHDYVAGLTLGNDDASTPLSVRVDVFRAVTSRWQSDGMPTWREQSESDLQMPPLATTLLRCSPGTYAAFILAFVEEFEVAETAEILGWDLEATENALSDARLAVKEGYVL